jgi:RNA polymerase sigma-70 factor (ECF subfamily)
MAAGRVAAGALPEGRTSVENEDYRAIKLCLKGKTEAFAELVDRYNRRVYNLAYRLTGNAEKAKDIAQEAFIRVYRALDKYDPRYKFSSWLLKTVSNLCIDYHRTKPASQASLEGLLSSPAESSILYEQALRANEVEGLEAKIEVKELQEIIREGIDLLPIDYKAVVVMRHVQSLSYREIAVALNLPMGTIKARIHRARKLLKGYLESRLVGIR